jgi:hypothetical protein
MANKRSLTKLVGSAVLLLAPLFPQDTSIAGGGIGVGIMPVQSAAGAYETGGNDGVGISPYEQTVQSEYTQSSGHGAENGYIAKAKRSEGHIIGNG